MRRSISVIAVLAAAGLALAGCGSNGDDKGSGGGGKSGANQVEVFTWWTTGSEAQGLDALVKVLADKYPDVKFVNGGVTGGGGSGKDKLQTRLANNQPPDSFQAHAGAEMMDYIEAGQVQDVSNLYEEFGLTEAFPADLLDLVTKDGNKYSIPSNVHRANILWASVPVLEGAGIDPTQITYASIDDFIKDLDKIKAATPDITPLSVGTTWTQVHLLECVLIAELGPDAYNGLWDGSTDPAGPEVAKALATFEKLMSYTNADRDSIDWEPATQMLLDGGAAFNIMGDWVPALFMEKDVAMGTDWVWAASPGTDGVFDFLADSFTLCAGAPDPEGAKAWLDVISSVDGQAAFNQIKGSIPARVDVPMTDFSEYQQQAAEAYASDKIVGSLQHGAAATIAQGASVGEAVTAFTSGATDLKQFQDDFAKAING
ncbi:MAG: ABC transporter substrate-binding protein [Micrococcales bacterium]|nr:ABC transporter substrate-binding protein [Micrococcales bacterium]